MEKLNIGNNLFVSVYDRDRGEDVGCYIYPNWTVAKRELFRLLWSPIYGISNLADHIELRNLTTDERVNIRELAEQYGVKCNEGQN